MSRFTIFHLFVVILGVLIVSDAHELLVLVGASENKGSNAEDVFWRDLRWVGGRAFELERVHTSGDGTDQTIIKLLIELLVSGGRDVDESPLEV